MFRNQLFERTTLYDLQCYTVSWFCFFGLKTYNSEQLASIYLLGTSMVHVAWPVLGLGLRFAQEKGLHRRKGKQEHTAEDELEKRVFWLVSCVIFFISFNLIY